MKYVSLLLLFLYSYTANAQPDERFSAQRAQYFKVGMAASIHHFDSMLQNLASLRNQNKLTEIDFLAKYDLIENAYKEQPDVVAIIAEKWTLLLRQRPSRIIKSALSAINGNHTNIAFSTLQSKKGQLNRLEQDFFKDLYLFVGDQQNAEALLPKELKDSLAKIWETKFETFNGVDTVNFIERKIFIAQKFEKEKQLESAIGTMLEAQKWNTMLGTSDVEKQKRTAQIAQYLAAMQLSKTDIDNAYKNAKQSVDIYESLSNENVQTEYAQALYTLAQVYKIGGANKEAETYFYKTIAQYEQLSTQYPQRYQPILANVLEDFAQVQLYFDLHDAYDKNLNRVLALRRGMATSNFPFNLFQIGRIHNQLGQKKMNTNLKVFLAQDEWQKSNNLLDSLFQRLPMLAGQEWCNILYKLGGSNISLKKRSEALVYFSKSLSARKDLYKLAPTANKQAYVDILIQNGTLNAMERKNNIATLQLDLALKLAEELGDNKRAQEIRKFKKDVLTH